MPQPLPSAWLSLSTHAGVPVEQSILPTRHGLPLTGHAVPAAHAVQVPARQTDPWSQLVPFSRRRLVSEHDETPVVEQTRTPSWQVLPGRHAPPDRHVLLLASVPEPTWPPLGCESLETSAAPSLFGWSGLLRGVTQPPAPTATAISRTLCARIWLPFLDALIPASRERDQMLNVRRDRRTIRIARNDGQQKIAVSPVVVYVASTTKFP